MRNSLLNFCIDDEEVSYHDKIKISLQLLIKYGAQKHKQSKAPAVTISTNNMKAFFDNS